MSHEFIILYQTSFGCNYENLYFKLHHFFHRFLQSRKPKKSFSFQFDGTFMTNLWFDMCKIDRLNNINDNFKLIDSFWSCLASQSQEWSAQSQKKYGHRLSEWSLSFNRFANYWRDSFIPKIKCNRWKKKRKWIVIEILKTIYHYTNFSSCKRVKHCEQIGLFLNYHS